MLVYRVERNYSTFAYSKKYNRDTGQADIIITKSTSIGPYRWRASREPIITKWEARIGSFSFKHITGFQEDRHPPVRDDRKLVRKLDSCCQFFEYFEFCFSSLEQLEKWFDVNDRVALGMNYHYIGVYETDLVIEGHTQSLFKLDKSTLVDCKFFENDAFDLSIYDDLSEYDRNNINKRVEKLKLRNIQ